MFEGILAKLGLVKKDDGSLIKKLETMKKNDLIQQEMEMSSHLFPEMMEQIKRVPEDISRKIDEIENKKINIMRDSSESVKNLEEQMTKLDQAVISAQKRSEEINARFDKTDKTVVELLSLYEFISKSVYPINEKITHLEKTIDDLHNKPQEIAQARIEEFNTKFKTLENNIDDLKKTFEAKAPNENAFVEKVAEMVVERTRPRRNQRQYTGSPFTQNVAPGIPVKSNLSNPRYTSESEDRVRLQYLDNSSETSIILLNWLEFLMEKVGRNNLSEVLEYYIEIGWINEEVCSVMMAYTTGIDYFVEKPSWKLLPEDHTKSLMFIEQLLGNKVDRMVFSRLERDVNRIIGNKNEITVH